MLRKYGIASCTNPDEVLQEESFQHYAEKERSEGKKRVFADIEVADQEHALHTSAKKISSADNISMVSALENAQNVATNIAIARCFLKNSWSFNGIDSDAFKKMVSEIQKASMSYKIPNRKQLTEDILKSEHSKAKHEVQNILSAASSRNLKLTLISDGTNITESFGRLGNCCSENEK